MELKTAFEQHLPLKIVIEKGHERVVAEGFIVKGGIVFWDVGWYESSGHPIQFIAGKVSGRGPWTVGDKQILEMERDEKLFQTDWEPWQRFRNHPDGKLATRELAEEFTKEGHEIL